MDTIQKINWLMEQYIKKVEDIEKDLVEQGGPNVRLGLIAGIYKEVIEDLQEILEEGDD